MADFTKLVRTLTSATHEKPTSLKGAVGVPFWIGSVLSFAVALYFFQMLSGVINGYLVVTVSLLAGVVGGVLIQACVDLFRGIRGGEVRKRYLAALVSISALAFVYGVIYYRTPESGFERVFSIASLVIISALFGYIVGRAKG